jgi:hypothetical protein
MKRISPYFHTAERVHIFGVLVFWKKHVLTFHTKPGAKEEAAFCFLLACRTHDLAVIEL